MQQVFHIRLSTYKFFLSKRMMALWLAISIISTTYAQDSLAFTQQEIIYGRKDGTALTMLMLKPKAGNGRGIISMVSGNWQSSFNWMSTYIELSKIYLDKGYTVFLVVHGSQPRYAIPDAVADVKRAVQFVRYNAGAYNISPDYIGITGSSSGGHLALTAGLADNAGDAKSTDPVNRVSGKVQAVACFFPPTDFINFGTVVIPPAMRQQVLSTIGVLGAFQFKEWDSAKKIYTVIEDTTRVNNISKAISPAWLVTSDDAPVFIWHGDADKVVPLQQSQLLKQKLEAAHVPVVLKIKPGAGHGWPGIQTETKDFVTWFDTYLKPKNK